MRPQLERLAALGEAARAEQIEAVYLLGMGGSSLCAEVLRQRARGRRGAPAAATSSTRPTSRHITTVAARMDAATGPGSWCQQERRHGRSRLDGAASSGRRLSHELGERAGRHFIAITDPGPRSRRWPDSRGYREVFVNPADIGGRFSALSLFGLVPAALIGRSAADLLSAGETMADGCRQDNLTNPGLELGAFIGAAAANGRDKLTVVLPPSLATLGLWIEQLIAESTGKHGQGRAAGRRRSRSGDPTSTAPIARSSRSRTDRDAVDDTQARGDSRRPAIRCCA